jgi:hypothetical protein
MLTDRWLGKMETHGIFCTRNTSNFTCSWKSKKSLCSQLLKEHPSQFPQKSIRTSTETALRVKHLQPPCWGPCRCPARWQTDGRFGPGNSPFIDVFFILFPSTAPALMGILHVGFPVQLSSWHMHRTCEIDQVKEMRRPEVTRMAAIFPTTT